jgi:AraC-like DNA-binding protein
VRAPAPPPEPSCSAGIARSLLALAAASGTDPGGLARDAQLPIWILDAGLPMIPARTQLRLWEAAERAIGIRHLPLAVAAQAEVSKLGLYGYLFATAGTLREALRAGLEFVHLVSTCSQLRVEAESDREVTYSCRPIGPGGRGADLGLQFCVGSFCTLASRAAERAVYPARVEFAQPAPRSHGAFTEMFGTGRVDFGAPVTAFTFTASDLDSPMRAADPVLARILRRYAASLPMPAPVTWYEHFRNVLEEAIDQGLPSLEATARRMAVSPRTLQRRLFEHGTTWRAELESARQHRARAAAADSGRATPEELAGRLGYAGPRSVRRAMKRWCDGAR